LGAKLVIANKTKKTTKTKCERLQTYLSKSFYIKFKFFKDKSGTFSIIYSFIILSLVILKYKYVLLVWLKYALTSLNLDHFLSLK